MVKLPRLSRGWRGWYYGCLNNINEAHFSDSLGACPVRAMLPGGIALVARRARPLTTGEWLGLNVGRFCDQHRLVVEHKIDSFGMLDGRIVAVDYGWPWEIKW